MPHSTAKPLPWGNGTFARFALGNCDTLVLLVHGFDGGAATTWTGLEALADGNPATTCADIISYGYNSTSAPVANSAVLIRSFIDAMQSNDPRFVAKVTQATGQAGLRNYARILIVAHSLGAVVVRRALLDAIECDASWPKLTQLIFFAPAHMGTRLFNDQILLINGLGGIIPALLVSWKLSRPVIEDIKVGSSFLERLASDTSRYIADGWVAPLRASQIVFGEKEKVVVVDRFCNDPIQKVWPNHTHTSICKVKEAGEFVCENIL